MAMPSDVMYGLHHDIVYRRLELVLFSAAVNSELLQFELQVLFRDFELGL